MKISWCKLRGQVAILGFATFLISFSPATALAQTTVSGLPSTVTGLQSPVAPTGPTGPTYSTFTVTSPATGPISVAGNPPNNPNPYNAWCWNPYGYIQATAQTYNVYSSYDAALFALSGAGTATEWQEVNWVINHKTDTAGLTTSDIQNVIWNLLVPNYTPLSAAAQTLYNDAVTKGPGFTPAAGQLLAIVLYAGGINPNDTPANAQDIFIEYLQPSTPQCPGLKIVKCASVKMAKCTDKVTYTYTVTNTGNVVLTNVTIVDDNATPNYAGDDITIATGVTLQPNQSQTYTRTLYLPVTEYGADSSGTGSYHTLLTQQLPNGNMQVTLIEDLNLVDNTYGQTSTPDWGSNGNNPWNHLGQDLAEFQFVDGNGNTVLDFAADYVSFSNQYPTGVGTSGVSGGAGQMYFGDPSNIVSINTSITDNLNQSPTNWDWLANSAPANYPGWKYECSYTIVVKNSCFGKYGYGGCNIKKIQHGQCKNGNPYQCNPKPQCQNVTNKVKATASATVYGKNQTITATSQATVTLSPGGQQSCQPPPTCKCTCWNCQHGDHDHCQNTKCQDQGCKQQQCQQQQKCPPQPCRPQDWWKQSNQIWQQCR